MRILIGLFKLSIGGSHINAIEIGSLIKQRGHDVIVYSPDGPLRERVAELGLATCRPVWRAATGRRSPASGV